MRMSRRGLPARFEIARVEQTAGFLAQWFGPTPTVPGLDVVSRAKAGDGGEGGGEDAGVDCEFHG